jgi:predicted AAA+ superfamily ATPase
MVAVLQMYMVSKKAILEIMEENKDIGGYVETTIPRDITGEMLKFLKSPHVIVITGVRRAGKSTIMMQMFSEIAKENKLYINFEDERLEGVKAKDLENIYGSLIESTGKTSKAYLFLDEIQEVAGWEKWVRRKYDGQSDIKFIISGSNSSLMSSEFSSLLTGRNITFHVFPFSFKELLTFQKIKIKDMDRVYYSPKKPLVRSVFSNYMEHGGFPEIQGLDKIIQNKILQQYFSDILYKDVVKRYNIRDAKRIEKIAHYLITNIGNYFSYYKARNVFKMSIETISEYAGFLENSFMIFQVPFFTYTLKERETRPRKTYSIDVGLRNAVSFKFSKDLGRGAENVLFIHLLSQGNEVYYWKNKRECDFIVFCEGKVADAINICMDIGDKKTREREVEGLLEAMRKFKLRDGVIITDDYMETEKHGKLNIEFIPLWVFLLRQDLCFKIKISVQ